MIISVLGVVAAVVAAWMLIVSPKADQASSLGTQVATAQSRLVSAQEQVAAARAAQSTYATNYTSVARLGEAVPADDNIPSLIVELQSAASHSKVDFRSLALGGNGAGATPASAVPAAATQAAAATLPPGASVGSAALPTMPFTFTFRGSFFDLSDFFGRLQSFVSVRGNALSVSGRLLTINSISLNPGATGFPQIVAQISATAYLVPQSQGLTAGATPACPSTQTIASTAPATTVPATATTIR
jgi:hypothetical protein